MQKWGIECILSTLLISRCSRITQTFADLFATIRS